MIERWKRQLDKNGGIAGGILMDLSSLWHNKHDLLIAKLEAYGLDHDALAVLGWKYWVVCHKGPY